MSDIPALVISRRDGTVVSQNANARCLLGTGRGRPCWDVFGGLSKAEGLPCAEGCVGSLVAEGLERTRHTAIGIEGRTHYLTCAPIGDVVDCLLTAKGAQTPENWQVITARERQVLQMLADGDTTPSIAERLGLSESTVRTHVENMRTKLGVPTRAALVALAFRLGFLE